MDASLDQLHRDAVAEERRRALREPKTWLIGLVPLAIGVLGIATGAPLMAIIGIAGAVGVPFGIARQRAQAQADRLVLARWAETVGLVYHPDAYDPPPPRTPILRHGDRQKVMGAFTGEGPDGHHVSILNLRTQTSSGSGSNRRTRTDWFTVLRVEQPLAGVRVLRLHRRTAGTRLFDGIDGALTSERVVELESVEFDEAFRIEVDDAADDGVVRAILTPARMMELLDHRAEAFEIDYEDGYWTTHLPGRITWGELERVQRLRAAQPYLSSLLEPAAATA